jgi:hypothetical protein
VSLDDAALIAAVMVLNCAPDPAVLSTVQMVACDKNASRINTAESESFFILN